LSNQLFRHCICLAKQGDQIGQIFAVLDDLTKCYFRQLQSSPNIWAIVYDILQLRTGWDTFLAIFGRHWTIFGHKHLVTLLQSHCNTEFFRQALQRISIEVHRST
jgi:hypothetical protein